MIKNWDLIKELAWSDFKVRYKGSILGIFWSFLKPILLFAIFYVVFAIIFKSDVENYALFILLGIIMWNFLVEATNISMNNMLVKKELLKSIYFSREVLVISSCLNALITAASNLALFFIIALILKLDFSAHILFLFVSMTLLFVLTLGISYILAALYVKYRDITHIWEVCVQIGFWITPIVYSIGLIPNKYMYLYMINPFARIINDAHNAVLYHTLPNVYQILITAGICIIVYIIGYKLYKYRSKYFAEEV